MERISRHAPALLLGLALVCTAAMTLILTRQLTFLQDTWEFLMTRRDPSLDVLFHPHNEHLVVFPVLIEEALLRIFGMTSATPEYVVLTAMLLGTAALLYVYLERRVGAWPALLATVVVLTLGPAWEVLLWPFEITFVGPVFFGLAMLLALEREDRGGDLLACICLVAALGFSGLGIPFLAAGAVAVAPGAPGNRLRRAWVVAVPLLLFAVWYLHWGEETKTHVTAHNVLHSPVVVAEAVSVSVGALFGLAVNPVGGSTTVLWGAAILVVAIVVLGRRARRGAKWDKGVWPVAAAALAFWVLMAFNQAPGRDATASRYQYGGAIFVLLIVANLLAGWRPARRTLLICAAVTAVAVGLNLVVLRQGRDELAQQSLLTRSDTAAIEIARRSVDPMFQLNPELAGTTTLVDVFAGSYLEAVDEYGSPAYTPAELAAAPEPGRRQADVVLAQALPLSTVTQLGEYAPGAAAGCVVVAPGNPAEVPLGAGLTRIEVAPGPHAGFSLRRFAVGEHPVVTEGAPGESVTRLRIPADAAPAYPWLLQVKAQQEARVCAAAPPAG
jgi:hypothetical protein